MVEYGQNPVAIVFRDLEPNDGNLLLVSIASVLASNHTVISIFPETGPLSQAISAVSDTVIETGGYKRSLSESQTLMLNELISELGPTYAITNSYQTLPVCYLLQRARVPVVALLNDFAFNANPLSAAGEFIQRMNAVVFPSELVADSYYRQFVAAVGRKSHIIAPPLPLPQLTTELDQKRHVAFHGPYNAFIGISERDFYGYLNSLAPTNQLVAGLGAIQPNSGVELFLSVAAKVIEITNDEQIRFAWFGNWFSSSESYLALLQQQVKHLHLEGHVEFVSTPANRELLLQRASVLLLTEQFGALNLSPYIATLANTPVVAFGGASSYANWAAAQPELADFIVPYGDTHKAAQAVVRALAASSHRYGHQKSQATQVPLSKDISAYAERLDQIGQAHQNDFRTLGKAKSAISRKALFDANLSQPDLTISAALHDHLYNSLVALPPNDPRSAVLARRPAPGFHPLAYAEEVLTPHDEGFAYAHFLNSGTPEGRWNRKVITPASQAPIPMGSQKILIHGHFHYPDLLPEFLSAFAPSHLTPQFIFTTTSANKAKQIRQYLKSVELVGAEVREVPNIGRNLGPLFTGLATDIANYEFLLHFHGKKSVHSDSKIGELWRKSALETLVGPTYPMADIIIRAFAADPRLGLVSPESGNLTGWDFNLEIAKSLAIQLGITEPLPMHFDFPVGAMFWARSAALKPVIDLGLAWTDYPPEPVAVDGTMLHALERLIPFVVESQGFTYAKAYVPGVTR